MGMSGLQAEHGRNVVSTLAKRAGPCAGEIQTNAEYWEFSRAGSAAGSCGGIHSHWLEGLYTRRMQWPKIEELRGAGIVRHGLLHHCADLRAWWAELAVTSGGARRAVGMASDSTSFGGSNCLKLVPFSLLATAHPTP